MAYKEQPGVKHIAREFLAESFSYDKSADAYTCPAGAVLTSLGTWHNKKGEAEVEKPVVKAAAPKTKGVNPWKLNVEIKNLEAKIANLETEIASVNAELSSPNANTDFAQLGKRSAELDVEMLETMAAWEERTALLASVS